MTLSKWGKLNAIKNVVIDAVGTGDDAHAEAAITFAKTILGGGEPVPAADQLPSGKPRPNFGELITYRRSGKIMSIKEYRTRTGLGLKESKDAIEEAVDALGLASAQPGTFTSLSLHNQNLLSEHKAVLEGLINELDRAAAVTPFTPLSAAVARARTVHAKY